MSEKKKPSQDPAPALAPGLLLFFQIHQFNLLLGCTQIPSQALMLLCIFQPTKSVLPHVSPNMLYGLGKSLWLLRITPANHPRSGTGAWDAAPQNLGLAQSSQRWILIYLTLGVFLALAGIKIQSFPSISSGVEGWKPKGLLQKPRACGVVTELCSDVYRPPELFPLIYNCIRHLELH